MAMLSFKNICLGLIVSVIAYFSLGWLYQRFLVSDENKVRAVLEAAAQAIRDKHPRRLSQTLSDDFVGLKHLNADDIHRAMQFVWSQFKGGEVQVLIQPDSVPVVWVNEEPKEAEIRFEAMARARSSLQEEQWLNLNSQHVGGTSFKARIRRTEGNWLFVSIDLDVSEKKQ